MGNNIELGFLDSYIQSYFDRFEPLLNDDIKRFTVEVWYCNEMIGILFKVTPINKFNKKIIWLSKSKDEFKIGDDEYGFEKDYFYIFKPNNEILWDNINANNDIHRFMDAILRTNKR